MKAVRSSTCSNDQTSIKQRLHEIVLSAIPGQRLEPSFGTTVGKHQLGLNHPQVAVLLSPLKYAEQFELDYERYVGQIAPCALLIHIVSSVAKVHSGEIAFADDMLPAHLYPPGTKYNPNNICKGAFRGRAWIMVCSVHYYRRVAV